MTAQIGTGKRESFSSMEVVSVVATTLILVMIAVPFPYASRDHALPALHTTLDRRSVATDMESGDVLKNLGGGKPASFGYASQGSPFEVRTVGRREFCADKPGLVRFSTTGARCRNGTLIPSAQLSREQLRP